MNKELIKRAFRLGYMHGVKSAGEYTVQSGDILGRIAKQHGTTVDALATANGLSDPNKLKIGQKLTIPDQQPAIQPTVHTVQNGDILGRIAKQYGTTVNALTAANGLSDPNKLRIGQKLTIPSSAPAGAQQQAPAQIPTASMPQEGPLGYRQNNPGNLRSNGVTMWDGATGVPPKDEFLSFKDQQHGIRAMSRVLYNYAARHGINTVPGVVKRYAPSSENNTEKYISELQNALGLSGQDTIDLKKEEFLKRIVPAMIQQEIGKEYLDKIPADVLQAGIHAGIPTE